MYVVSVGLAMTEVHGAWLFLAFWTAEVEPTVSSHAFLSSFKAFLCSSFLFSPVVTKEGATELLTHAWNFSSYQYRCFTVAFGIYRKAEANKVQQCESMNACVNSGCPWCVRNGIYWVVVLSSIALSRNLRLCVMIWQMTWIKSTRRFCETTKTLFSSSTRDPLEWTRAT